MLRRRSVVGFDQGAYLPSRKGDTYRNRRADDRPPSLALAPQIGFASNSTVPLPDYAQYVTRTGTIVGRHVLADDSCQLLMKRCN